MHRRSGAPQPATLHVVARRGKRGQADSPRSGERGEHDEAVGVPPASEPPGSVSPPLCPRLCVPASVSPPLCRRPAPPRAGQNSEADSDGPSTDARARNARGATGATIQPVRAGGGSDRPRKQKHHECNGLRLRCNPRRTAGRREIVRSSGGYETRTLAQTAGKTGFSCRGGAESGARGARSGAHDAMPAVTTHDAELQRVIDAWPTLRPDTRAAVAAIVASAVEAKESRP